MRGIIRLLFRLLDANSDQELDAPELAWVVTLTQLTAHLVDWQVQSVFACEGRLDLQDTLNVLQPPCVYQVTLHVLNVHECACSLHSHGLIYL